MNQQFTDTNTSFYIDQMKRDIKKKHQIEAKKKVMEKIESLNQELKSAKKSNLTLREVVRRSGSVPPISSLP